MEKRVDKKFRRKSARLMQSKATNDCKLGEASACVVEMSADPFPPNCHGFSLSEIASFRHLLLDWYSLNKRQLPWRSAEMHTNPNVRFYAVWVSEVMLQQTQVATVIEYYNRWMKRWPTLTDLSKASLEDVHQLWSGLGYYSRAKRLLETSKLIDAELNGVAPQNAAALQKLPGIGKYTACAIASIAFNEVKGVVDGNVMRVLTRLRLVGADVNQRKGNEWLWQSVNLLVDPNRPGDFNQALMEFGATVCTPRNPSCSTCPLQFHCWAFKKFAATIQASETASKSRKEFGVKKTEIADIECVPDCGLCIPRNEFDFSLGVMNYPCKGKKKVPRVDQVAVVIPYREGLPSSDGSLEYFMVKRSETGLLASLWEFPNVIVNKSESDENQKKALLGKLKTYFTKLFTTNYDNLKMKGQVLHIFSHIRCTYVVYTVEIKPKVAGNDCNLTQWLSSSNFQTAAISTAMRKVFKVVTESSEISKKRKRIRSITKVI